MEKRIKRTQKGTKSSSYSNEEKTIIATVVISIIIIIALLVQLTVYTPIASEPFSAIYYLDSEKMTENIPKTVVLGENSTFPLWIGVENQNGTVLGYSVQVKLDDGKGAVNPSLAKATEFFNKTLKNGEKWEFQATINIEQPGSNRVIFELWFLNMTRNGWDYTGNWVSLSVEAT
jgi:uncharacterized membrane protein